MGSHPKINVTTFPTQGAWLGKPCTVCFHYETATCVQGVIVRDDAEDPWITIIRLADNRYVLATECQYSLHQ